jgi:S1-C subfamily serine protease
VAGAGDAPHFLDEVPYPLAKPLARELRGLLASAIHGSNDLAEALSAVGFPLDAVFLDRPARYVWGDILVQASQRNPQGGARAIVGALAAAAPDLGKDFLQKRLEAYLADVPPPPATAPLMAPPSTARLEKVLGSRSAFVDPASLPFVIAAARSVVRIAASFDDGPKYGTGFVIGERRILTNHHVLYQADVSAQSLSAWFDYEADEGGAVPAPAVATGLVATIRGDRPDDVGIFEVDQLPGERRPLVFAEQPVTIEAKVAIVQHPLGLPKQVAFHTVVEQKDGLVHYLTDTEPGSSGSPVLDRRGRVVALHHASKDVRIQGREVPVNEGIAAPRVLSALGRLGVST